MQLQFTYFHNHTSTFHLSLTYNPFSFLLFIFTFFLLLYVIFFKFNNSLLLIIKLLFFFNNWHYTLAFKWFECYWWFISKALNRNNLYLPYFGAYLLFLYILYLCLPTTYSFVSFTMCVHRSQFFFCIVLFFSDF